MLETHSLNKGLRPAARSAPGGLLEMQVSGPSQTHQSGSVFWEDAQVIHMLMDRLEHTGSWLHGKKKKLFWTYNSIPNDQSSVRAESKHFKAKCVHAYILSHVWLFCNPIDCSLPGFSSMEFSRQEYWSGFSFPSPGNLLDSGIKPMYPALEGGFFTTEPPGRQN